MTNLQLIEASYEQSIADLGVSEQLAQTLTAAVESYIHDAKTMSISTSEDKIMFVRMYAVEFYSVIAIKHA